jgi:FAD/FMN-containing dehydrogenase
VSVTSIHTESGLDAARQLRFAMQGRVVLRGDDDYPQTRQVWNRAVKHEPTLIAVCETPADVQAAVRSARKHGFPLSVRGGGHDWVGRSVRHGGMVIDPSHMRRVEVDADAPVATVQGGATIVAVISSSARQGLVAATGACGAVGMVGLTTGGGYGPLTSRYGLELDNLLSA